MSRPVPVLMLVGLVGTAPQVAAQDAAPDLSFLEYLGSWQEGDEEWFITADWEAANAAVEEDSADGVSNGGTEAAVDEPGIEQREASDRQQSGDSSNEQTMARTARQAKDSDRD